MHLTNGTKSNVNESTSTVVVGKGPQYGDLRKLALGLFEGGEPQLVVKQRFHFISDMGETLVIWFCGQRLYQKRMTDAAACTFLNSLGHAGFELEPLQRVIKRRHPLHPPVEESLG